MARTATQPTATPQDRSLDTADDQRVTAREWFAPGARRPYDPIAKTIAATAADEDLARPLHVFEKVVASPHNGRGL